MQLLYRPAFEGSSGDVNGKLQLQGQGVTARWSTCLAMLGGPGFNPQHKQK
jgi:hypothetical protein